MPIARALHEHLGIQADVLLRPPDRTRDQPLAELTNRFLGRRAASSRAVDANVPMAKSDPPGSVQGRR